MPGFSAPTEQMLVTAMLAFARIGTCMMVMPGMSSARVPVKLRLFLAIALSLAVLPLVSPQLAAAGAGLPLPELVTGLLAEMLVGATFGFIAQACFWALQFMANIIAMSMGYSGQPGTSVIESMPESSLANLLAMGALMLFFASNMHLVLLQGLVASYSVLPVSLAVEPQAALIDVVDALSGTFPVILRLAAPFLLYAILVNFATGLINRMTPTIPVYFISLPFVIAGGLVLFFFLAPEILNFFSGELAAWIEAGP